jgi:hypothetical protein
MSLSSECWDDCIKKGDQFCVTTNAFLTKSWNSGYCCQSIDDKNCENEYSICTDSVGTSSYNSLRVGLCPNQDHCYGGQAI